MLRLDFSCMTGKTIGRGGISGKQLDVLKAKAHRIHKKIVSRSMKELAFLDLPQQDTSEIKKTASWIKQNCEDFILLGIGGSALGPRAILEALSPLHNLDKKPRVFIYDNVDPRTLNRILSTINLKNTAVNVITKSGSTAETMASFMILWEKLSSAGSNPSERIIATTDPSEGSLRKIANEKNLKTLSIPKGVGGRYSVLSPVGLLLAEVIGMDSDKILKGAKDMQEKCADKELSENPAYLFGSLLYLMKKHNKRSINVIVPYADGLKPMGEWFCQLWAESLGKQGKGLTPYPSLGTTDQHSQLQLWMQGPQDKVVVFIRVEDYAVDVQIPDIFSDIDDLNYLGRHKLSELIKAEQKSTELALTKIKRPSMTITIPAIDEYHIGQLFHFFEIAAAFTGFLCDINPFNQPGVEQGKNFTYAMMGRKGFEAKRKEAEKASNSERISDGKSVS